MQHIFQINRNPYFSTTVQTFSRTRTSGKAVIAFLLKRAVDLNNIIVKLQFMFISNGVNCAVYEYIREVSGHCAHQISSDNLLIYLFTGYIANFPSGFE